MQIKNGMIVTLEVCLHRSLLYSDEHDSDVINSTNEKIFPLILLTKLYNPSDTI
jgi:hypothetical protein